MKKCTICKKQFPETSKHFHFRKDSGKLRNECKTCLARRSKTYHDDHKNDDEYLKKRRNRYWLSLEEYRRRNQKYYSEHRIEILSHNRNERKRNPAMTLMKEAKHRATKKNLKFDIQISDIILPTHCPIFGIPLSFSTGRRMDNSYSLDRVDNTKGYIKGNVLVVSWKANRMKGDASIKDLERLVDFYRNL